MEFLLGLLAAVAFFIAFYLGTRYNSKKPSQTADEFVSEEQRKAKKQREDFMKLINYDVEKATARKKVT